MQSRMQYLIRQIIVAMITIMNGENDTVASQFSYQQLINKIQDIEDKASKIRRKRNLSSKQYYFRNEAKEENTDKTYIKNKKIHYKDNWKLTPSLTQGKVDYDSQSKS